MGDVAPDILYSVDRAGDPIAIIERRIEAQQEDVLKHYPGMLSGELTLELAQTVNHFARGFQYEVIDDPAAFADAYRRQIGEEDPEAPFQEGNPRLRDFGIPDFDAIDVPKLEGGQLTFYARNRRLGVPYRVEVRVNGVDIGEPTYTPMPMSPAE